MRNTSRKLLAAAFLCAAFTVASVSHAALISRLGGQAYYDTFLDITWLANANLIATNTFGLPYDTQLGPIPGSPPLTDQGDNRIFSTGIAKWGGAIHWIDAMNSANYLGVNNWRLPKADPINGVDYIISLTNNGTTDWGYNISGINTPFEGRGASELALMFLNNLGNIAQCAPDNSDPTSCNEPPLYGLINTGPFSNLQAWGYWSGSETNNPLSAWILRFHNGLQVFAPKGNTNYAWPVADGDVFAASAVPIPAAVWLFGSGLVGLIGIAKYKKNA